MKLHLRASVLKTQFQQLLPFPINCMPQLVRHMNMHYTNTLDVLWAWRDEGTNADFWSEHIADYLLNRDAELWAYLTKTAQTVVKK